MQINKAQTDLSKLVKVIECALKEMSYYIAFHCRHIVQLDCNWSLKSFQPHVYFMKSFYSDILYQICCLQPKPAVTWQGECQVQELVVWTRTYR